MMKKSRNLLMQDVVGGDENMQMIYLTKRKTTTEPVNREDEWLDDVDWEELEEEEYDVLGNELIPNPLLDSMDPDGAAERFPELARDPRFWFDMFLFVCFLDLLSVIGPQDPFPDFGIL